MYKLTQLCSRLHSNCVVQLEQCKSEQLRQQKSPIDHEATSCVQKTKRTNWNSMHEAESACEIKLQRQKRSRTSERMRRMQRPCIHLVPPEMNAFWLDARKWRDWVVHFSHRNKKYICKLMRICFPLEHLCISCFLHLFAVDCISLVTHNWTILLCLSLSLSAFVYCIIHAYTVRN